MLRDQISNAFLTAGGPIRKTRSSSELRDNWNCNHAQNKHKMVYAIEKSLHKKCSWSNVNKWIMSIMKSRILPIFTGPCGRQPLNLDQGQNSLRHSQRFADDLTLIATLESPSTNEMLIPEGKSRRKAIICPYAHGQRISALKTHYVMFTWMRKWNFRWKLTMV